ncbi:uncharacterized protein ACNS7B_002113 [Menidia menidia]
MASERLEPAEMEPELAREHPRRILAKSWHRWSNGCSHATAHMQRGKKNTCSQPEGLNYYWSNRMRMTQRRHPGAAAATVAPPPLLLWASPWGGLATMPRRKPRPAFRSVLLPVSEPRARSRPATPSGHHLSTPSDRERAWEARHAHVLVIPSWSSQGGSPRPRSRHPAVVEPGRLATLSSSRRARGRAREALATLSSSRRARGRAREARHAHALVTPPCPWSSQGGSPRPRSRHPAVVEPGRLATLSSSRRARGRAREARHAHALVFPPYPRSSQGGSPRPRSCYPAVPVVEPGRLATPTL